jgi:predicted RNA-binding protein with TRAM domain
VSDAAPAAEVGQEFELEVGPVAHGGHCVARLDGRVVFVRHALPGERVRARVTEGGNGFWRADAVEVLEASPDRVEPAWPAAGADGVGGGELSHVALPAQRRWKQDVLVEQLQRLARIDAGWLAEHVTVEGVPGDDERRGLHYRTRIDLVAGADGHAGMRKHRSHDVVPLKKMPLASAEVAAFAVAEDVFTRTWTPGTRLELVAPSEGDPVLLVDGEPWRRGHTDTRPNARRAVTETVTGPWGTHRYRVAADGFWQVHRAAPAVLTGAVLEATGASAGELAGATVLDLYSGAGLFTLPLADAVGPQGHVVAVKATRAPSRTPAATRTPTTRWTCGWAPWTACWRAGRGRPRSPRPTSWCSTRRAPAPGAPWWTRSPPWPRAASSTWPATRPRWRATSATSRRTGTPCGACAGSTCSRTRTTSRRSRSWTGRADRTVDETPGQYA